MLLGHIGIGFAAKTVVKKIPLWALLIAVMIPDLISFFLILIGLADETGFWSHSLLMTTIVSAISAIIIFIIYRHFLDVLVFCGLIYSHWVFDFINPAYFFDQEWKEIKDRSFQLSRSYFHSIQLSSYSNELSKGAKALMVLRGVK